MRRKRRKKIRPFMMIIFLVIIAILLMNVGKIYEKTYGMLEEFIIRPNREIQLAGAGENISIVIKGPDSEPIPNLTTEKDSRKATRPGKIKYEMYYNDPFLFMEDVNGILPWSKYFSVWNYNDKDMEDKRKERNFIEQTRYDATIEYGARETVVEDITNSRTILNEEQIAGNYTTTSRSIARYEKGQEGFVLDENSDSDLAKDVNRNNIGVGLSYIFSHIEKDKDAKYTDYNSLQLAVWLMRYVKDNNVTSEELKNNNNGAKPIVEKLLNTNYLGANDVVGTDTIQLFNEAKALQEYIDERKALQAENDGQLMIDKNTGKYKDEAGLVSYRSESTPYIMVGPFSFDYTRKIVTKLALEDKDRKDCRWSKK